MTQQMSGVQLRTFSLISAQYGFGGTERQPLARIGRTDEKPITLTYDDYVKLRDSKVEGLYAVWLSEWANDVKPNPTPQPDPEMGNEEKMKQWENENIISYRLVTPEVFRVIGVKLVKGDLLRSDDVDQKRHVAVIGETMAKRFFGDADPIGKKINLTTGQYTVVGVIHSDFNKERPVYYQGVGMDTEINQMMFIPYLSVDRPADTSDTRMISEIFCLADKEVTVKNFHTRLDEYVQSQYGNRVRIDGTFLYMNEGKRMVSSIEQVIGIFGCVALLIAAINILNLMMARVMRRAKHIGIAAAVGGSRQDIFQLFMAEALLLGLMGSVLGVGLAYGSTHLLVSLVHIPMRITVMTWVIGIGSALLVSLVSGLYPASQAAKMSPALALKGE